MEISIAQNKYIYLMRCALWFIEIARASCLFGLVSLIKLIECFVRAARWKTRRRVQTRRFIDHSRQTTQLHSHSHTVIHRYNTQTFANREWMWWDRVSSCIANVSAYSMTSRRCLARAVREIACDVSAHRTANAIRRNKARGTNQANWAASLFSFALRSFCSCLFLVLCVVP